MTLVLFKAEYGDKKARIGHKLEKMRMGALILNLKFNHASSSIKQNKEIGLVNQGSS